MRDAFGGVFMMNLFLVFIVIYVAFTAVSLNYARAFRLKNYVIDFLETNEITSLETLHENYSEKLNSVIAEASYYKDCSNSLITDETGTATSYCYNGVIISKLSEEEISGTGANIIKYEVTTFADWNVGVLNKILALGGQSETSEDDIVGTWSITGEAKVVSKTIE